MKMQLFKHKMSLLTALCCVGLLCTMNSAAWAQPDLWIRDNTADVGNEPNTTTGVFWASPDIGISWTASGPLQPQPVGNALNWVHVTVRNRGTAPSSGTDVLYLYWAKASTGLSWPTQWVSYTTTWGTCTATIYGNQIGSVTIPSIAAGGSVNMVLQWFAPDPADYACFLGDANHFCLLARIEPGMTFTETANIIYNTQYNNNIAWRNCYLVKLPPSNNEPVKGTVLVRNVRDNATTMRLRVALTENGGNIFDHATVDMVLTNALHAKWQANGAQGENIEDQGNGTIRLQNANAWIGGIPMNPGETEEAGLQFTRTDADFTGALEIDMIQDDDGEDTGGERFTVDFSEDDGADGLATDVPDETNVADGISVYPNPAQTEFTISSVDRSANYSIRMLDILGREVYSTSFSGDLKISVEKFSKGTYYLELKNAQTGTQTTKQIIVE